MRITIRFNLLTAIDIDFGYVTPLWQGMYWFCITKVYFSATDSREVEYAAILFNCFKHPKYWDMFNKRKSNSIVQEYPELTEEDYFDIHEAERNSRSDESNQY